MPQFAKVESVDSWGHLHWSHKGRGLRLRHPGECVVWWPDGTTERCRFGWAPRPVTVYDHGHTKALTAWYPVIEVAHHGATLTVPMAEYPVYGVRQDSDAYLGEEKQQ